VPGRSREKSDNQKMGTNKSKFILSYFSKNIPLIFSDYQIAMPRQAFGLAESPWKIIIRFSF